MPWYVTNALQRAYRDLGELVESTATGGSISTIADTKITEGSDDDWTDGVAFIIRDAAGASAAPEGEFQRISGWVASTGTHTVDTNFTAAVASGDTYGVAGSAYPIYRMIQHLNDALSVLGDVPLVDTTTLDTAASTTEYAAAVAWKRRPPFQIDIQGRTGAASDNQWDTVHTWEFVPAAAGTAGKIIFKEYPISSRDIRVWYMGVHGYVSAWNDQINETLHPDLVHKALMCEVLQARIPFISDQEREALNYWRREFDLAKSANAPWKPRGRSRLLSLNNGGDAEEDYFTYPTS